MRENTSNKILYSGEFQTHRYKSYIKLLAICFLPLVFSCKAKKQLIVKQVAPIDSVVKPVDTKKSKLDAIRAAQTQFNTFSGKARTVLNIDGSSNDVTLNIRIRRDQKIWISITAIAGIEAARVLITPDSILIINRLQAIYVKQPFSYINTVAGNQVNYKTIESLLIGNAIPELLNEGADFQTQPDSTILTGNLQDLAYKLIVGQDKRVTQTNLNNQGAAQSLQVTNRTFIQAGAWVIPSQIDIASSVKNKKIQVKLHYVKTDFDQPQEYPFSIPSRYKEGS